MRSIRRSLLTTSALGTAALVVLAGAALDRGAVAVLTGELDLGLTETARLLASTIEKTPKGIELAIEDDDLRGITSAGDGACLWIWLESDSLLRAIPDTLDVTMSPRAGHAVGTTFRSGTVGESVPVRVIEHTFAARVDLEEDDDDEPAGVRVEHEDAPLVTVLLARPTERLNALIGRLRLLIAGVGASVVLLGAAVLLGSVGRGLRPLERLGAEIAHLDERTLSSRVEVPDAPVEIRPIVGRLNELLARLEGAFVRERRFSADVAHELRTPLTGLRTAIEVELTRPRTAEEYRRVLVESLGIVTRMQVLVQRMLTLSRLDAGSFQVDETRMDLADLVRSTWNMVSADASAKRLTVDRSVTEAIPVQTDPALMEMIVRNLIENAVMHADAGGTLTLSLNGDERRAVLRVSNTGCTLSQADVPPLFDRFTRADLARRADDGHVGLGLALVRQAADALGLEVDVSAAPGGEFSATLRIDRPAPRSAG